MMEENLQQEIIKLIERLGVAESKIEWLIKDNERSKDNMQRLLEIVSGHSAHIKGDHEWLQRIHEEIHNTRKG